MNTPFITTLALRDNAKLTIEVLNGTITLLVVSDYENPGDCPERFECEMSREELKDIAAVFRYAWENSAALMRKSKPTEESNVGSNEGEATA